MGDEGRSTAEGDDRRWWELTKVRGSGFTSGGGGIPPVVGRGQEATGGEVVLMACLRRRKVGGKERGGRC
jgi:hypothetical protein